MAIVWAKWIVLERERERKCGIWGPFQVGPTELVNGIEIGERTRTKD